MPDQTTRQPHGDFDVAIAGAGVIGLSCAWRAAERGLRVCVLERGEAGAGASGVAAGMLAPVGEVAYGEQRLLEMNVAAARAYPQFVADLEKASGVPVGFRTAGALHVALDRDEAEALRRHHEFQQRLGLSARWLPPSECRELEPGLAPRVAGGVLAEEEASVDPRRLIAALRAAFLAAGGHLLEGADVSESLVESGRLLGVRTAAGVEIRAAQVVLATGGWSGAADWLPEAARPDVRPVKGQIVRLRGEGRLPCERIVVSERVYVVPREDGELVVGATVEERGFDTEVTAGGVHELLREAYRALPDIAELEFLEAAAGLRPATADNLPVVGPSPELPGLILATGHFRNGVLLAPLAAEQVAELLATERVAA